jgi:hypothetical protein
MKNNFEDIFNNIFNDDFLEDAFMEANKMRHGIKLMYLRKFANNEEFNDKFEDDEDIDHDNIKYKDGLPFQMFGKGDGLENVDKLMFWKAKENNESQYTDDWELIETQGDEKNKKDNESDDEEDFEDIDDEDYLENFITEHTKENTKTGKLTCNFCSDKKLSYDGMKKHFIKTHEKQYKESSYVKECTWKEAIDINKKLEKKIEKEFMEGMGGMQFDDFDDMGMGDVDFDKMFTGKGKKGNSGMKDFEKIMMDMLTMGMGGGNSKTANKSSKKKK